MPQYPQQVPGYPGNVISHLGRTQQQSYVQEQQAANHPLGMGPSPAKRPRQNPPHQRPNSSTSIPAAPSTHDATVDDEEDTSRGDLMDFLTPRDISTMRYTQHHEWMEEIFSSLYATNKIVAVDLGLGRTGELEALTHGFFEAPTGGTPDPESREKTFCASNLDSERAGDFTKHAYEKIANIKADMEKMKRKHAKRMTKLGRGSIFSDAEKRLRSMISSASETGTDVWRMGLQIHNPVNGDATIAAFRQQERIDEIARDIEAALGRTIQAVKDISCIQKGGLEEKSVPEVSQMEDTSMHDPGVVSADQAMDNSFEQPSSYGRMKDGELPKLPALQSSTIKELNSTELLLPLPQDLPRFDTSVDLGPDAIGLQAENTMAEQAKSERPGTIEADPSDWVMVNKDGDLEASRMEGSESLDMFNDPTTGQQDLNVPGDDLPDFVANLEGTGGQDFDGNDFGDGVDFGTLDTAGDALAGYGEGNQGIGTDENADLGLEDSAFGEAFHHTVPHAEEEGNLSGL